MTEIELQFLEIEPKDLIEKLKAKGAEFVFDSVLKQTLFDRKEWSSYHGRVRVRDTDGKVELAYKETREGIEFDKEIEFGIDDFDKAVEFCNTIGLIERRIEEKRRIRYRLDNLTFDIDFWPGIPVLIEIEGDDKEEILKFAESIGFDRKDAKNYNAYQLYRDEYGIKMGTKILFEEDDWRLDGKFD